MEPAALDLSLYKAALIVLGAAAVVIPLFHRLRVSSVLGFMLVGIVVGPFGLASLAPGLPWLSAISIGDPKSIEPIAQLGVVLLLFMIGLELSVERLIVMRRLVFGLGCLQVVLCAGASRGRRGAIGIRLDQRRGGRPGPRHVLHRCGNPGAVGGEAAQHHYWPYQLRRPAVPGLGSSAGAVRARGAGTQPTAPAAGRALGLLPSRR